MTEMNSLDSHIHHIIDHYEISVSGIIVDISLNQQLHWNIKTMTGLICEAENAYSSGAPDSVNVGRSRWFAYDFYFVCYSKDWFYCWRIS